jgi:hypothetical protein
VQAVQLVMEQVVLAALDQQEHYNLLAVVVAVWLHLQFPLKEGDKVDHLI